MQKITDKDIHLKEPSISCLSSIHANYKQESSTLKSISEFFISIGSSIKEFFKFNSLRWYDIDNKIDKITR